MTELSGFLYNDAGTAVVTTGCSVDLFPTGCNIGASGGSPTATGDTDANGFWSFSCVTTGSYDVRITSGCSVRFIRFDNEQNVARLESRALVLNDGTSPNYTIQITCGVSGCTDRTLSLPSVGSNATFAFSDIQQTISGQYNFAADFVMNDTVDAAFGTGSDSLIRWSTADASNHALVIAVGQCNQVLHIAEACDVATDWALAANAAYSEVLIHSSSTPATDYLMLGRHNGTTANIDVAGGTTLDIAMSGTVVATIDNATGLTITNQEVLIATSTSTAGSVRFEEPCGGSDVGLRAPALAATITFDLPPTVGTCGQQLTTNGNATNAVMVWAAASSGEYKDDLGLLDPSEALATIVATPVHQFKYNRGKMPAGQWGCFTHEMTGIFAEEAPWAMQGKEKGAFSPINSTGMLMGALQALEARVRELES